MDYVLLRQVEACSGLGISNTKFLRKYKHNLPQVMDNKIILYKVPFHLLKSGAKKAYLDKIVISDEDFDLSFLDEDKKENKSVTDQILDQIAPDEQLKQQVLQARRRKIIKETEYLQQKIIKRKQLLFEQWSEKFFGVFTKAFAKFKNNLIDLQLNEQQVSKLNDNLSNAVKNLEISLKDINNEFINGTQDEEQDQ